MGARLTEERVVQGNGIDALHRRILQELRIDVEEHRHIHRLTLVQPLLLETKALNLAEVRRNLCWCDAICRHSDDIFLFTLVRSSVESQRSFPGQDTHFSLLRRELPRQYIRSAPSERDS